MYSPVPRCSPRIAARCKLPFALRPGLSLERVKRVKEITKEMTKGKEDKGKP